MQPKSHLTSMKSGNQPSVLPIKDASNLRLKNVEKKDPKPEPAKASIADDVSVRSTKSSHSNASKSKSQSAMTIEERTKIKCDNCVNHQIEKGHAQKRLNDRNNDREHQLRVNASNEDTSQREKSAQKRKLDTFKDARDDAVRHRNQLKSAEKIVVSNEKQALFKQFNDTSDLDAIKSELRHKVEDHKKGMDAQYKIIRDKKTKDADKQKKLAQNTHNTLIDDSWRPAQKEELKKYYYENLKNQVNELRNIHNQRKHEEKTEEKNRLVETQTKVEQLNQKEQENAIDKKRIFNEENRKAVDGKKQNYKKDFENKLDTRDLINKTVEKQKEADKDILHRKAQEAKNVMNEVAKQKLENHAKRNQQKKEDHNHKSTGLHIPQKIRHTVECDYCGDIQDIKQTNKVYVIKGN